MIHNKFRYLLTLVALFAISTGAWAEGTLLTTINASSDFTDGSKTFDNIVTVTLYGVSYDANVGWYCSGSPGPVEVAPVNGVTVTGYMLYFSATDPIEYEGSSFTVALEGDRVLADDLSTQLGSVGITKIEVYGTAEAPVTVAWNASTKTGTFSMPGSDVVLTPLYAPAAKWDVVENVEQMPAALEGIIAGQDAAIVTPGQSAQGTVMYAVTPTAEAAPALTAFSATVPTAKTYDDATTVYVWYYIQGQDTPDGQQATEENTFNDSEISATPLKVDILTNKFDLTLSPAPVKNMTVTVAGQAKTPTDEGKVEAVKMQSEVKLKAATGYKFRKVEVKKGGLLTLSVCDETIYYAKGETWAEAIQNHPTENQGWGLSGSGNVTHDNFGFLLQNDDFVPGTAKIDPNASYGYTGL